jgi:pathogenesis-related protein 1
MRHIVRRFGLLTLCLTALAVQACTEDSNGDGAGPTSGGAGGTETAAGAAGSDEGGGGTSDTVGAGGTSTAGAGGTDTTTAGAGGTNGEAGTTDPGGAGGSKTDPDPPATGEPTSGPLAGTLLRHNFVRQNVSPAASPAIPDLVWSETIAASAQAYADKCVFEHSKGKYGENLYAGTAEPKGASVVDSWASEVADYDYASGKCSGVCGHYTQVVWRNSTELGCGYAKCTTGSPFGSSKTWYNWVCQYNPPGNYVGQKPY